MSLQHSYTQQQLYVTKHRLKQVSTWFSTWYTWQRRVFVCRLLEHCSRDQFEFLATALEPILHLDFSSLFTPHFQSLHVDGSATFQIQRVLAQSATNLPSCSWMCLESLPTTFESSSADSSSLEPGQTQGADGIITHPGSQQPLGSPSKLKNKQAVILPALPLTHVKHATESFHTESSIDDVMALRRKKFSSVPDFQSTADILKHVRHKELFRKPTKYHHRSKSFRAQTLPGKLKQKKSQQAELFKSQLADLSEVRLFPVNSDL